MELAGDKPGMTWQLNDFDQFTIEQLAGDLMPDPTDDQLLATAFHRNTMENDEGGTDDEEFRVAAVKNSMPTFRSLLQTSSSCP